jgi:hypothetical protein
MVAESFTTGASVYKMAQRYGVNANLLFTWRARERLLRLHKRNEMRSLHYRPENGPFWDKIPGACYQRLACPTILSHNRAC